MAYGSIVHTHGVVVSVRNLRTKSGTVSGGIDCQRNFSSSTSDNRNILKKYIVPPLSIMVRGRTESDSQSRSRSPVSRNRSRSRSPVDRHSKVHKSKHRSSRRSRTPSPKRHKVRRRSRSRDRKRSRSRSKSSNSSSSSRSDSPSRGEKRQRKRSTSRERLRPERQHNGSGHQRDWDMKYRDDIRANGAHRRNFQSDGGRFNEAYQEQQEKFYEIRRSERSKVASIGVPEVWAASPIKPEEDSDENSEKEEADKSKASFAESTDSEEERRKKKKKKKAKRREEKKKKKSRKKKSSKKSKKRKKEASSSSESESEESSDENIEKEWVEACAAKRDEDSVIGPLPITSLSGTSGLMDYGKALLPGEGAAMAAYVNEGKRIPRRGEIGLTSEEIESYEEMGYVMSGSRHRRMEAVRLRKENQIYSADEKRALATFSKEERVKRESVILSDFRELVRKKTKDK